VDCKQGSLEVGEIYSKLTNLWNELKNHVKVPSCVCKDCECEVSNKIVPMQEEEKTHQFFMGLNYDLYSQVRGQILTQEPVPPLDKIFNIILQEENHKRVMM